MNVSPSIDVLLLRKLLKSQFWAITLGHILTYSDIDGSFRILEEFLRHKVEARVQYLFRMSGASELNNPDAGYLPSIYGSALRISSFTNNQTMKDSSLKLISMKKSSWFRTLGLALGEGTTPDIVANCKPVDFYLGSDIQGVLIGNDYFAIGNESTFLS